MNTTTSTKDAGGGVGLPRLGIDIGRVIIDGSNHPYGGDTAFFDGDDRALQATPELPGAVESIGRLVQLFSGQVWLVSKCGSRVQQRTLLWLRGHRFHARTGLPLANVRFCRYREDKRIHCVDLGLTHFVDDRPDVHAAVQDVVTYQYLFGPQSGRPPAYVTSVSDWPELEGLITGTLIPAGASTLANT
jgi:hypothetical protein